MAVDQEIGSILFHLINGCKAEWSETIPASTACGASWTHRRSLPLAVPQRLCTIQKEFAIAADNGLPESYSISVTTLSRSETFAYVYMIMYLGSRPVIEL